MVALILAPTFPLHRRIKDIPKAPHRTSQSICKCFSFGVPAPFFVISERPLAIFWLTDFIQGDDYVLLQIEDGFNCGVSLDPSRLAYIFQLSFLALWKMCINDDIHDDLSFLFVSGVTSFANKSRSQESSHPNDDFNQS